jgi:hypothetical protein
MNRNKILLKVSILGVLLVVAKEQTTPIIQSIVYKKDEEEKQTFNLSDFISQYKIINIGSTTIAVGILPKLG